MVEGRVYLRPVRVTASGERPWIEQAACAGIDTELFFPFDYDGEDAEAAKRVCARCPVAAQCLNLAMKGEGSMATYTRSGIYAGTSPAQRSNLYKKRGYRAT